MTMPPKLLLIVFLHTILQLQEFFWVKYKVEEETITLITLLTIDFMAHGPRLLVNRGGTMLSCITFGFLAILIF
jgi:hypothetical protein